MPTAPLIIISAEFGDQSREGMVSLRLDSSPAYVMLPEQARKLAMELLQCAEVALNETTMMDFMTSKKVVAPNEARATLQEMRLHRERMTHARRRREEK